MLRNLLFISFVMVIMLTGNAYGEDTSESSYYCAGCGKVITKTAAVIDGKLYHPECFICIQCGKQMKGTLQFEILNLEKIEFSVCINLLCPNFGLLQISKRKNKNTKK